MGVKKELSKAAIQREYLGKDVSMRQACETLNCCATTLIRALRRHNLSSKPRTWNTRRTSRFPQLQDRNWLAAQLKTRTMLDIALSLGTSSGNVSDHVKRHGLRWKHYDRIEAVKAGIQKAGVRTGASAANWKGGRQKAGRGYIYVRALDHPCANKDGLVMEHRLVMETQLGRILTLSEVVHHKNGIKSDNRIENLEVMTIAEHRREHMDAHGHLHIARQRIAQLEQLLVTHGIALPA